MTAAFGRITANILIEIAAVHFRPDDPEGWSASHGGKTAKQGA